jgi:hypothetical protein
MSKSTSDSATSAAPQLPHSWDIQSWPAAVWPCSGDRARWVLRAYRAELVEAGALSRTGKLLIVLGKGYARWLDSRIAQVGEFESNNPKLRQQRAA